MDRMRKLGRKSDLPPNPEYPQNRLLTFRNSKALEPPEKLSRRPTSPSSWAVPCTSSMPVSTPVPAALFTTAEAVVGVITTGTVTVTAGLAALTPMTSALCAGSTAIGPVTVPRATVPESSPESASVVTRVGIRQEIATSLLAGTAGAGPEAVPGRRVTRRRVLEAPVPARRARRTITVKRRSLI